MLNLSTLQALFPRDVNANASLVGRIPMSFVEQNVSALATIVKENGMRRFYRGPRVGAYATGTLKSNAVSMLLYRK